MNGLSRYGGKLLEGFTDKFLSSRENMKVTFQKHFRAKFENLSVRIFQFRFIESIKSRRFDQRDTTYIYANARYPYGILDKCVQASIATRQGSFAFAMRA